MTHNDGTVQHDSNKAEIEQIETNKQIQNQCEKQSKMEHKFTTTTPLLLP